VIEAQGIARLEAIKAEQDALQLKMEAEQLAAETRVEESGQKVLDVATVVRDGIDELFKNPIAVTFDWGNFPAMAASAGGGAPRATYGGAMAEGGFGHVTRPTWFLAGEKPGGEDVMFSGVGKRFATTTGSGGGRMNTTPLVVQVDGRTLAQVQIQHMGAELGVVGW
jgi:hypothetical protein